MGNGSLQSIGCKCHNTVHITICLFASCSRAPTPTRPGQAPRQPVPLLGGTVSVSIVQTYASAKAGGGPARTPINRVLAHLERQSKARGEKLSDEVESFELEVKWEPVNGALAAEVPEVLLKLPPGDLAVVSPARNFAMYSS